MTGYSNGASTCIGDNATGIMDDRKARTLPPIWRLWLPLPAMRHAANI
jgi:hypothetical protein